MEKTKISTSKFIDTEFLSAKEKEKIFKNWKRFLKGLADGEYDKRRYTAFDKYDNEIPVLYKKFTNRLYEHLHLHCGFIAHYDKYGFYINYFNGSFEDLITFFNSFDYKNRFYTTTGDYIDINSALIEEYQKLQPDIFATFKKDIDEKFEVMKECIKRAEKDPEYKKLIVEKFFK